MVDAELSQGKPQLKGLSTIIGGFICNLVSGNLNNWGTISPYITSYLHAQNSSVTSSSLFITFPIGYIFEGLGIALSPFIVSKIGYRYTLMTGMLQFALAVFICYFITDPFIFALIYGISAGWAAGIGGACAGWANWQWYPNNKGTTAGIAMAGANCGPVLFGIVLSTLANPENIPPTVEVQRGAETDHLFDERVYERVPAVLLTLAIACGVLSVIGGFMVIDKSEEEQQNEDDGSEGQWTVGALIKTKNFWFIWGSFFCSFMYWAYIMNEYKVFGLSKKVDDKFLSWLGSLGNIVGMASRTLWGIFMDLISFKLAFGVITGVQLLNSLTIYFIASNKWCYVTWIAIMYLMGCGNFVCVNIQCSINYGKFGEKVFGLAATGMALSTFSTMFVEFYILEVISIQSFGFMVTFYFLSVMNLLAFIFSRLVVSERISVKGADKTVPLLQNDKQDYNDQNTLDSSLKA